MTNLGHHPTRGFPFRLQHSPSTVWPILALIAAALMAIMSLVQFALAARPFAL
jgi:hypothetical protein